MQRHHELLERNRCFRDSEVIGMMVARDGVEPPPPAFFRAALYQRKKTGAVPNGVRERRTAFVEPCGSHRLQNRLQLCRRKIRSAVQVLEKIGRGERI
jgi:hypothetical protein